MGSAGGRGGRGLSIRGPLSKELVCLEGEAGGRVWVDFVASCCFISSPMLIFRIDMGIRLTRLSILARKSAH